MEVAMQGLNLLSHWKRQISEAHAWRQLRRQPLDNLAAG